MYAPVVSSSSGSSHSPDGTFVAASSRVMRFLRFFVVSPPGAPLGPRCGARARKPRGSDRYCSANRPVSMPSRRRVPDRRLGGPLTKAMKKVASDALAKRKVEIAENKFLDKKHNPYAPFPSWLASIWNGPKHITEE